MPAPPAAPPRAQTTFLSAATGKAFTTVFAGFAFTTTTLPNISRLLYCLLRRGPRIASGSRTPI